MNYNDSHALQSLSLEDLNTIHQQTVKILKETGMIFSSCEARQLFKKNGFKVDGEVVYIKEEHISRALKTAPQSFEVRAPNPERSVKIGAGNYVLGPSGGAPYLLEYGRRLRKSTSRDCRDSIKISHALPSMDFNRTLTVAGDVPGENIPLHHLYMAAKLTDKPLDCISVEGTGLLAVLFGVSPETIQEDTRRGVTYAISYINPISPLRLSEHESDRLFGLCQNGVALGISPMPMAGMTGPCTLPGLLILQNCEILGTLVLSQLINPGAPVLYGCIGTITEMKNLSGPIGAPETRLIESASAKMADFYGIPSRGNVGLTDANAVDFQAGVEASLNFTNAINSGIHLLPGLGALGSWNLGSLEKLVLDAEIASYLKRMLQPLTLDRETMAVEVIQKTDFKGNYLAEVHTSRHFRNEFYRPGVFNRDLYEQWTEGGKKEAYRVAHEKVHEILRDYTAPPLDGELEKEMDRYVQLNYPVEM